MTHAEMRRARRAEARRETDAAAGRLGMDALAPERLVALLESDEPFVPWAAADRLVARGHGAVDALIGGLAHPDARMRAACALLLDHVADARCVAPLRRAMRDDPHASVRRCAMHALVCDGCKECPLDADAVGALIESTLSDRSRAVRRRAVFYLSQQRPDPRTAPALARLLAQEPDAVTRRRAEQAPAGLQEQD